MNTIKKILLLLTIAVGAKADVSDEIARWTNTVNTLCGAFPASKDPEKKGNRERCQLLVTVGKDAVGISQSVENFINKNLGVVSKKGDELIALLKCMDKGGMATQTCKNMNCTSENDCIALILKTTKELLDPVVKDLIASASKPGTYDGGALLKLSSLRFLPKSAEKYSEQMRLKVANFADTINSSLDFINALSVVLSPKTIIASTPNMTPAEKDKLTAIEPITLPADTQINPNLEADFEGL